MATLTSTGDINLTTPTNWSPSQIPQDGDDLIIAAGHTLTADKDFVANTITTNATTSKITISGTPRTLTATNGWFSRSNTLFNTISNSIVNIFGQFTQVSSSGVFSTITDSTVKLSTIGENQSETLFITTSASFLTLCTGVFNNTSTITTIGLFNCVTNNANGVRGGTLFLNNDTSGTWNHYSVGLNVFRNQFQLRDFNTPAAINLNINGNFSYATTDTGTNARVIYFLTGTARSVIFNGNHTMEDIANSDNYRMIETSSTFSGTLEINGKISYKNFSVTSINAQGTCLLLHRNQSYTINSDETVSISIGASASVNLTNTQITINGNLYISPNLATTILVDSATLFSISTTGLGIANIKLPTLRNKFVRLPSVVPVLPERQYVTAGITYGFSGSELTGTALLLDPAILASAISANIPDIVDGVHEADTRDYDDIPGSIGFEFKKLRQANPFIEFIVTDDITPTDTEFAVSITDAHETGSFSDSVLWFSSGNLTNDNNPILSLVKNPTHSIITLQKPMRIAPAVGDTGFIDPSSHIHSIPEIQNNLALEQSVQDVETAIGLVSDQIDALPTVEQIQTGLALQSTLQSLQTTVEAIPTSISQEDIDAIKSGLALEATSESILTAIGEIDVDFTPILNRLPTELEDGRMASVLSSEQVSTIRSGLALDVTSQNILNGVISLNTNDRGEFF